MDGSWWLGIGLGIGVLALHTAGRILAHSLSSRASDHRTALLVEMGGIGGRMLFVFVAVALVLLFVPVHPVSFVVTVIALLVLGMVVETRLMARRMERDGRGA